MRSGLARWAWLPIIGLVIAVAVALRPGGQPAPTGAQDVTETPTLTATPTPTPPADSDGDGCTAAQEAAMGFDDTNWYDFFDVPVPANADPTANGSRNKTISMGDVLAVLFYFDTQDDDPSNANGVDYDSVKGSCTVSGVPGQEEGLCYDRSAGPPPDPVTGNDPAGPPSGKVNMVDVIVALTQVGLDCGGVAGPAPTGGPNAMAVDANPSTAGVIETSVTRSIGFPFQVSVNVTQATTTYQGYDLLLEYDESKLAFVPDSWEYTGLGSMIVNAVLTQVGNRLQGGCAVVSEPINATGQAVLATFECVTEGASTVHLVTSMDNPAVYSTTLLPGGAPITTTLADATVVCALATPTPTPTPTPTLTPTPSVPLTPTAAPNAMAIDADASSPEIDLFVSRSVGLQFDVSTNITRAGEAYAGYEMEVQYDPGLLQFVPVGPANIVYTGLGGMTLDAEAVHAGGLLSGGSARGSGTTTAVGQANLMRFRCVAEGIASLDLTRPGPAVPPSTTLDVHAAVIGTDLADAQVICLPPGDFDGDGCLNDQEVDIGFDPLAWYDVYDVPAPVAPDPTPNGPRSRKVDIQDVLAVLFYFGTQVGGGMTVNGVDYESLKDGDWNGDTLVDAGDKVGLRYDRSAGLDPDPVTGKDPAGPPSGKVDMIDVMTVLAQYGLNCAGPP